MRPRPARTVDRRGRCRRLAAALCAPVLAVAPGACTGSGDGGDGPDPAGDRSDAVTGTVAVFAAASLVDAFDELGDAFEDAHPGATVELNAAASSRLRDQILEGAPADVFASASPRIAEDVVDAGAAAGEPVPVAANRLQVAVPAGNPGDVAGLADLADGDLLVGLCAEQVPCGRLGRRALEAARVAPALDTEEPDARALLTKIEAAELDAGIVYRTDVLAAGDAVDGIDIPPDHNVTATYLVVRLAEAPNPAGAAAFAELVLSPRGREILASHGFDPT